MIIMGMEKTMDMILSGTKLHSTESGNLFFFASLELKKKVRLIFILHSRFLGNCQEETLTQCTDFKENALIVGYLNSFVCTSQNSIALVGSVDQHATI